MIDMNIDNASVRNITKLAELIEQDIRRRRLGPGDSYLSTAETARILGVSTSAANRALQLLAKRKVIVRSQRRGASIPKPGQIRLSAMRRVHLLVDQSYRTEGIAGDGVIIGIQGELPSAEIQLNFIPPREETEYLSRLIAASLKSGDINGFVLIRASLEAQRMIQASGLPAVVYGTLQPSVQGLPSIDRDHHQIGYLLTRYLLGRGFKRILMLSRQVVGHGDNITQDGVIDAMAKAKLSVQSLMIRHMPSDEEAVFSEVSDILAKAPSPTGIISRCIVMAQGAQRAVDKLKFNSAEIALCDFYQQPGQATPEFMYPRPTLTAEQQGTCIGQLLARQARGEKLESHRSLIPVMLNDSNNRR